MNNRRKKLINIALTTFQPITEKYLVGNGDADEDVELDEVLFLSFALDERIC